MHQWLSTIYVSIQQTLKVLNTLKKKKSLQEISTDVSLGENLLKCFCFANRMLLCIIHHSF